MSAASVTLQEIVAAATARRASLVPETSGYVVLAICDALGGVPIELAPDAIALTVDGAIGIARRPGGSRPVDDADGARAVRALLGTLLSVSIGSMPGLAAAAKPRASERTVADVAGELEAALIPVNRAAAKRALARLARETFRAKEAGKLPMAKPDRTASTAAPNDPSERQNEAAAAAPRTPTPAPAPVTDGATALVTAVRTPSAPPVAVRPATPTPGPAVADAAVTPEVAHAEGQPVDEVPACDPDEPTPPRWLPRVVVPAGWSAPELSPLAPEAAIDSDDVETSALDLPTIVRVPVVALPVPSVPFVRITAAPDIEPASRAETQTSEPALTGRAEPDELLWPVDPTPSDIGAYLPAEIARAIVHVTPSLIGAYLPAVAPKEAKPIDDEAAGAPRLEPTPTELGMPWQFEEAASSGDACNEQPLESDSDSDMHVIAQALTELAADATPPPPPAAT